jgi:PKD repeat protein
MTLAKFELSVDDLADADALAGFSRVRVDARGSIGDGLTFLVDFGDGTTTTTAVAEHTYGEAGTYTVRVEVRDREGQPSIASRSVVVRDLPSAWLNAYYATVRRAVDIRTLRFESGNGSNYSGNYRFTGSAAYRFELTNRSFTATLVPPRTLRISTDMRAYDAADFEGAIPARVGEDMELPLTLRGDSLTGEKLVFRPIKGTRGPFLGPVLKIQSLGAQSVPGGTSLRFDASASTGNIAYYFIEYGDGQVGTDAVSVHAVDSRRDSMSATLILVDNVGFWDDAHVSYSPKALATVPD